MTNKYRAPEPLCDQYAIERASYKPETYRGEEGEDFAARLAARRARRGDAPPEVTRGERLVQLVAEDGKIVEIPARRGYGGDAAFIDWVNFTVLESSFYWGDRSVPVTDDQLIASVSIVLDSIFGYGVTAKREKGANFYHKSWDLGDRFGLACYGGQRDTVLISISGAGLAAAKEGWEKRLYDFLSRADRPCITRVDLAHDDYSGASYSVDKGLADYHVGLFSNGGRPPEIEQRGNWQKPNGKGRTLYIGTRRNGKYLRVYEKGRELGFPSSDWVRIEGELRSVDRIVPLDVLLDPGAYLAAMYPALGFLNKRQKRIETKKREAVFSYEKALGHAKRMFGALLWMAREVEGSADALIEKIGKPGQFPKSIKHISDYRTCAPSVHHLPAIGVGGNLLIA